MSVPSGIFKRWSDFQISVSFLEENLFQIPRPAVYRQADPLNSTETIRLIRDGEKGDGGRGREGDYIPVATLSPPE